ncbi:helix-turn-helix domain-containing protein [Chryseobacterium sp. OSA05B]|uniref:helix-turn-helix domain-containing protein n=1 Tax=Chryseobacterium sp. OSA05B TaxID=2862650 RepID=UPI001CC0765D|nr:helix-turn-helix transcriptional regulator [Chryseobacterium sp. OSA05B]
MEVFAKFVVVKVNNMNVGENIKRIRTAKNLSQKEVTINAGLDTAQYSRIENGKTDPSVNTLERIAKALGITLAELFASTDELKEINSLDKSLMEKVALMESLSDEEKQTIYTMLDAFIGKRKLKDALSNVLQDVK